jgi:hypothetical protein
MHYTANKLDFGYRIFLLDQKKTKTQCSSCQPISDTYLLNFTIFIYEKNNKI